MLHQIYFLQGERTPLDRHWRIEKRSRGLVRWLEILLWQIVREEKALTRLRVSILGKLASDLRRVMLSWIVSRFLNFSRKALSSSEMFSMTVSSRDNSVKDVMYSSYKTNNSVRYFSSFIIIAFAPGRTWVGWLWYVDCGWDGLVGEGRLRTCRSKRAVMTYLFFWFDVLLFESLNDLFFNWWHWSLFVLAGV